MKGVSHSAWGNPDGNVVVLSNDDDGYYSTSFESREEVDEFVAHLYEETDKVFPSTGFDLKVKDEDIFNTIIEIKPDGSFWYKGENVEDVENVYERFNEWLKYAEAESM